MEIRNKLRDMLVNDVYEAFGYAMAHVFYEELHGAKRRYCERGVLKMAAMEGARQHHANYMRDRRLREISQRRNECDG
jgi:hypothetical protein